MEQPMKLGPDPATACDEKADLAKTHTAELPPSSRDSKTQERDDDDRDYPTGARLVLIGIALCLGVFLIALEYGNLSSPPQVYGQTC